MNDRREVLEAAAIMLAELIDRDTVYLPIFIRIDDELSAETGGVSDILEQARRKVRLASSPA